MKKFLMLVFSFVFVLPFFRVSGFASPVENSEKKPTVTVACVGDSVTEGLTTSGGLKGSTAYPAVLERLLNGTGVAAFTVNNFGKSATTAQKKGDHPYRKTVEYRESLKSSPDVVLIGLGANDSKAVNWNEDLYWSDYYALISEYLNLPSKPKVYLLYTTYVADPSKTGCRRDVIQNKILPMQNEIAEELGVKIIDLNTLTRRNSSAYSDGVHPNDELQRMMAEYIFNALCSENAVRLSPENATAVVKMIEFPKETTADSTDIPSDSSVESNGTTVSDRASSDSGEIFSDSDTKFSPVLFCIFGGIVLLAGVVVVIIFITKQRRI